MKKLFYVIILTIISLDVCSQNVSYSYYEGGFIRESFKPYSKGRVILTSKGNYIEIDEKKVGTSSVYSISFNDLDAGVGCVIKDLKCIDDYRRRGGYYRFENKRGDVLLSKLHLRKLAQGFTNQDAWQLKSLGVSDFGVIYGKTKELGSVRFEIMNYLSPQEFEAIMKTPINYFEVERKKLEEVKKRQKAEEKEAEKLRIKNYAVVKVKRNSNDIDNFIYKYYFPIICSTSKVKWNLNETGDTLNVCVHLIPNVKKKKYIGRAYTLFASINSYFYEEKFIIESKSMYKQFFFKVPITKDFRRSSNILLSVKVLDKHIFGWNPSNSYLDILDYTVERCNDIYAK